MRFDKQIKFCGKTIENGGSTFIIAEAGVNHNGDMALAKKLIDLAAEAKADAVKFQTFKAEHLILDHVSKAPYQKVTTDASESQFQMLKRLEVTETQNALLRDHCNKRGIIFLTTPFDEVSLDSLDNLDLPAYKIASTDLTNLPFLKKVAKKGKPLFLSTGMSYLEEVEKALEEIYPYNTKVVLLQCSANYPIRDDEANLNVLNTYKSNFDILLGYSDHSVGIGAAPYAIPMGATVVEKHFTLDRGLGGPDQKASLLPDELIEFVRAVRQIEVYLGTSIKAPSEAEVLTRKALQKCMVASKDIRKGDIFSETNMIAKRTGGVGASPILYRTYLGTKASRDFSKDDILEFQ